MATPPPSPQNPSPSNPKFKLLTSRPWAISAFVIIIILLIPALLITLTTRQPIFKEPPTRQAPPTLNPTPTLPALSHRSLCEQLGGQWLDQYQECENIKEQECTQILGGTYNSCDSPCRHQSGGQACIQMCVAVCRLTD